jgi:hypothetical protein
MQRYKERVWKLCVFWQDYAFSNLVVWSLFDQHMKAISLPSLNRRRPVNKNLINFETYKAAVAQLKFLFNYFISRFVPGVIKFLLGRFFLAVRSI